jgi:CO/xanthine dehydrogenase FAD-binding subunit
MKNFTYYEPTTVEQASDLCLNAKGKVCFLAGGTDLLVMMKTNAVQPKVLINLKSIKGLQEIEFRRRRGLRIGALVTWTQLLESKVVAEDYPVLRMAAESMASQQIRNVATLAGNICHASPAANGPIPLLLYQAECLIHSPKGPRKLPAEKMFIGVQKSSLRRGEVLTQIELPSPPSQARGIYYKFAHRRAMDLALVGVGALVTVTSGTFRDARLALAAVNPIPLRAKVAEETLVGRSVSDDLMKKAADLAAETCEPITDLRGSKEYRREIVRALTYRALKECTV